MSAWRQPLLWLVLALPAATVVAGFTTLGLAAAGPDTSGDAAVKRTAQAQVEDLAPDLAAAHAGLAATLRVDRVHGAIEVALPPGTVAATLVLRHPVDAALDRTLALARAGDAWRARTAAPLAGNWLIELHGANDAWRLDGRLARDADAARLAPRLRVAPPA